MSKAEVKKNSAIWNWFFYWWIKLELYPASGFRPRTQLSLRFVKICFFYTLVSSTTFIAAMPLAVPFVIGRHIGILTAGLLLMIEIYRGVRTRARLREKGYDFTFQQSLYIYDSKIAVRRLPMREEAEALPGFESDFLPDDLIALSRRAAADQGRKA